MLPDFPHQRAAFYSRFAGKEKHWVDKLLIDRGFSIIIYMLSCKIKDYRME